MFKLRAKLLFGIVLFLGLSGTSYAQKAEIGVMFGGSNYHGDLAYQIVPSETHAAGGVFGKYNFNPYWSWRTAVMYGKISGSDKNFDEYRLRNLSFESNIWELSTVLEFNYLPFGSNVLSKDFSSYLFIGLAGFHFNPRTEYKGQMYDLRNFKTEGQSSKNLYSLVQISVPFGGGFKYNLSKNWVFGWEVGWRTTWTDYLDDVSQDYPDLNVQRQKYGNLSAALSDRSVELDEVSQPLSTKGDQRGDPNFRDYYFFTTFSLAYRFTPIVCWPKYHRGYFLK